MAIRIDITPNGRMPLPAEVRDRPGLSVGGTVYLSQTDDGVVLRTLAQSVAHAQALAQMYTGKKPGSSVDDFLVRRRSESGD